MPESNSNTKNLRVIIAGGGTGGHIFPAIAIANAIKALVPRAEFLFIGAKDRMEMEKVPAAGFRIEGLWISGLSRSLTLKNLLFPFKVILSTIRSKKLIKKFKPDVVVGVGGYSSGPVLRAATSMGIPALIQEQNSYAGLTNRLLSKSVSKVCVAYDNMDRFFSTEKIEFTGNPVRDIIENNKVGATEAREHYNFSKDKQVVFAVGGSLGSRTINSCLAANLEAFSDAGLHLLWQTGTHGLEMAKEASAAFPNVTVTAFIDRMDIAYSAADIIISRAGAIAVSELCFVGKPVILIPFPFAAEDHQFKNASALEQQGAAIVIKDQEVPTNLIPELMSLVRDAAKQEGLANAIKTLAKPSASTTIAQHVIALAK